MSSFDSGADYLPPNSDAEPSVAETPTPEPSVAEPSAAAPPAEELIDFAPPSSDSAIPGIQPPDLDQPTFPYLPDANQPANNPFPYLPDPGQPVSTTPYPPDSDQYPSGEYMPNAGGYPVESSQSYAPAPNQPPTPYPYPPDPVQSYPVAASYPAPQPETYPPAYPQEPYPSAYAAEPYSSGYPPYSSSYNSSEKNSYGVGAIILGIASFFGFGALAGIPAIIFGVMGLKAASEGRANNKGVNIVGIVLAGLGSLTTLSLFILLGAAWFI